MINGERSLILNSGMNLRRMVERFYIERTDGRKNEKRKKTNKTTKGRSSILEEVWNIA